ncbi:MAG TPA: AraC family ligand binding domain-containing protein [Gaiellaceae bacterium]|nr:AraC family ligand binding domain-containing protein [Gaiellaceae bacterium]
MNLVHLDDLERIEMPDGFVWRPVRKHFGIQAFGVNAYTPGANGRVIEEHTERVLLHEEIYLVLRGRVRFTVGDEEHELGRGQLVFLRDATLRRGAVALTDDAAVLAIGGKPGEAHEISAWEYTFAASPDVRAARYDEARRLLREGLEAKPGAPAILYDLACVESLAGETDTALELLDEAIAKNESFREYAQTDEDFAAIRDDPRFPSSL